ncbi:MAG: hypothetical protein ACP5PB_10825, partial [Acidimicrobiales bacterium]
MTTTPDTIETTHAKEIAAKLRELEALGIDVSSLRSAPVPTVADFTGQCLSLFASQNTARTYRTHYERLVHGVGPICDQTCAPCLDPASRFECRCECSACRTSRISLAPQGELPVSPATLSELNVKVLARVARRLAVKRGVVENRTRAAKGRSVKPADGASAEETAVAALRSLCESAKRYLASENPAREVHKPRRPPNTRRSLVDYELVELYALTANGGDDPELDLLLVDYGIETGARRQGAYGLTCGQLAPGDQLIMLKDKYDIPVPTPVSDELMERLLTHAITRGGSRCDPGAPDFTPDAPVFWYRERGSVQYRPITSRRFDTLHSRWQRELDWAGKLRVSFHFLRHTIAEKLKAEYGYHYAARYLRHAEGNVTDAYGSCTTEML